MDTRTKNMNLEEEENYESIKRQRTNAKRKFTRKCNAFQELSHNKEHILVIKEKFEDIREIYKEIDKCNDRLLHVINRTASHGTMNNLLDEADAYMTEIDSVLDQMRSIYAEQLPENGSHRSSEIQVKPLDSPRFSGNLREYSSFRHDFLRLMASKYGKDAYALRSCLFGSALDTVKGVEDNFDEMLYRLDKAFGDPRKFVDTVIQDLKILKPIAEGDTKQFISMVNVIERSWLDLKRMGLSNEMNTVTIVSMIERLLPPTQKREWILKTDSKDFTSKEIIFENLLQYLLQEKRVIEYMEHDVRISGKHRYVNQTVGNSSNNTEFTKGLCLEEANCTPERRIWNEIERVSNRLEHLAQVANISKNLPTQNDTRLEPNQWCWVHKTSGHAIASCDHFAKMTHDEKLSVMRKVGACFNCLQTGHIAKDCAENPRCTVFSSGKVCGKRHHPLLHRQSNTENKRIAIYNAQMKDDPALLAISTILCNDQLVTVLWDSGANISLITHSAAKRLNLLGSNTDLSIVKVGNQPAILNSKKYTVPLIDLDKNVWNIDAYGMDEITTDLQNIDEKYITKYFPEINIIDYRRPTGKVDILIGVDCCAIMPNVVRTVDNAQLLRNQFGYCIRGTFPGANERSEQDTSTEIRANTLLIRTDDIQTSSPTENAIEKFFKCENFGISCHPQCGGCRCGNCSMGMKGYTLKEERELALIKAGLKYNEEEQIFEIAYPWIKGPENLPNNIRAAKAKLRSTESRLNKLDTERQRAYREQMKDMERRKVARKLSQEEVRCYTGPVHYLHHHEIIKGDSSTTPVRIVFNSSASYMGHALNDYWAKGPDFVNNLYGILIRFREYPVAIATDISKMYNSIRLSSRDQHVHRYLWRDLQTDQEPHHYALTAVPFGDRPSGTIAMVALHTIADMNMKQYPEAARMIKENSYVDDLLQSVTNSSEALALASDVQNILAKGNFNIKHWVFSGDKNENASQNVLIMKTKRVKILGMFWETQDDNFVFEMRLNFSQKRDKMDFAQNVMKSDSELKIPEILTRKLLLRQVAMIYDPIGLIVPFTLKGKLLMRELVINTSPEHGGQGQSTWDEPVSESCREDWIPFLIDIFKLELLRFPRCIKPPHAIGQPTLVIFSDASSRAYGACAYVHWEIETENPGDCKSFLVSAKNKIAPTRQLSIPRLELCAAVLGCRLGETIQKEMTYQFAETVYIVDSIIVRSQIQKESYGFGTFVATRIAEIQEKTSPSQWWWTNGSNNPADIVTRPARPEELDTGTIWQNGPSFLEGVKETWPISQKPYEDDLPDRVAVNMTLLANYSSRDICNDLRIDDFSNYDKLLRVTARLLRAAEERTLSVIGLPPEADQIEKAETFWVKLVQQEFSRNWEIRFKRLGPSITDQGILTVGKRISKWLKQNWNQDCFVLLPNNHPFTTLLIQKLHKQNHGGVENTLARLQTKFWVPGARRIIKKIKKQCVICRKLLGQTHGQVMGQLTPERLQPSPPFYNTALDMFGPFLIRDTIKRRTKAKVYGVLFTCLASRAVYIDLVSGYGTQDFLLAFRRFVTLRGYPATLYSDAGSQLVAASKELRDMIHKWDLDDLSNAGANHGLKWTFTKSSDAPWQNGCSESLIRLIKRAITIAVGDSVLTFGELQTVLFEAANLLNERPIGRKPGADPTAGVYLSPNDLLLGRTQIAPPHGRWADNSRLAERFLFLQRIVSSFWEKWYRDYFSTLITRQKWHEKMRNLRPGDIVLVQENKPLRGKWKLAEVVDVEPSSDGNVRDATLRYKTQTEGRTYTGQPDIVIKRSVHRLVLLIEADS